MRSLAEKQERKKHEGHEEDDVDGAIESFVAFVPSW